MSHPVVKAKPGSLFVRWTNMAQLENEIKKGNLDCIPYHAVMWFEEQKPKLILSYPPQNLYDFLKEQYIILIDQKNTVTLAVTPEWMGEYFAYLREKTGVYVTKANFEKANFTRVYNTPRHMGYYKTTIEKGLPKCLQSKTQ